MSYFSNDQGIHTQTSVVKTIPMISSIYSTCTAVWMMVIIRRKAIHRIKLKMLLTKALYYFSDRNTVHTYMLFLKINRFSNLFWSDSISDYRFYEGVGCEWRELGLQICFAMVLVLLETCSAFTICSVYSFTFYCSHTPCFSKLLIWFTDQIVFTKTTGCDDTVFCKL